MNSAAACGVRGPEFDSPLWANNDFKDGTSLKKLCDSAISICRTQNKITLCHMRFRVSARSKKILNALLGAAIPKAALNQEILFEAGLI